LYGKLHLYNRKIVWAIPASCQKLIRHKALERFPLLCSGPTQVDNLSRLVARDGNHIIFLGGQGYGM
jgi:hypothetical protein